MREFQIGRSDRNEFCVGDVGYVVLSVAQNDKKTKEPSIIQSQHFRYPATKNLLLHMIRRTIALGYILFASSSSGNLSIFLQNGNIPPTLTQNDDET